jgi:hypothetical protein
MAHPFYFFDLCSPMPGRPLRHSNHSPISIRTPYPGPFRLRGAISTETVPDDLHETSRAIQSSRLVPVPFRTMSSMISDLGKHCYATPRFMRRRAGPPKSPQITVFHTQSAWAAESRV